jgi:hypothetical protein
VSPQNEASCRPVIARRAANISGLSRNPQTIGHA